MILFYNGVYRETTAAEDESINRTVPFEYTPTLEDRIAELESALDALLSGRTN